MPDLPDDVSERINGELFAGRKIQAIKLYREAAGVGLREAKEAIDAHEATLRDSSPERFVAPAKSGCMTMIALVVVPAVIGAIWI